MKIPTRIERDVEIILRDYELRETGITQFYVGSTKQRFDEIMKEVGTRAGIAPEKWITHVLTTTNEGGLDVRLNHLTNDRYEGGYLFQAYGFAEANFVGHGLNQRTDYRHFDREKSILGIHIDSTHQNYDSALRTAKDSHFKVNVIEYKE